MSLFDWLFGPLVETPEPALVRWQKRPSGYAMEFSDGTAIRDDIYHCPSGEVISTTWRLRCIAAKKRIEWGQEADKAGEIAP